MAGNTVYVKISKLKELCNPVGEPPWSCGDTLTPTMVWNAVQLQNDLDRPLTNEEQDDPFMHARRIAWFVRRPRYQWNPISIDVGIPHLGTGPYWIVEDGNHRLYAAVICGEEYIAAEISGDCEYAIELFDLPGDVFDSLTEPEDVQPVEDQSWIATCIGSNGKIQYVVVLAKTITDATKGVQHCIDGGDDPTLRVIALVSDEHGKDPADPLRAITYALTIDDHYDRLEFLNDWNEGVFWPEYLDPNYVDPDTEQNDD